MWNPSRTLSPCFRALGPPLHLGFSNLFLSSPYRPTFVRSVGGRPPAVRSFMHVPSIFPSAVVSAAHLPSLFVLSLLVCRFLQQPSLSLQQLICWSIGQERTHAHGPKLRCAVHGPVPSIVGQLSSSPSLSSGILEIVPAEPYDQIP